MHYLAEHSELRKYSSGETILSHGDTSLQLNFIISGEVSSHDSADASHTLSILGAGDLFGEHSLSTNNEETATIVAKTEVEVAQINSFEMFSDAPLRFLKQLWILASEPQLRKLLKQIKIK